MSKQQLRSGVSTVPSNNGIICYLQLGGWGAKALLGSDGAYCCSLQVYSKARR